MSADNAIVVLGTKRTFIKDGAIHHNHQPEHKVYRVAYVFAWSLDYFKEKQLYNVGAYLLDIFGKSKVFLDKQEALDYAHSLEKSIGYVEYGVNVVDTEMYFYKEY